MPDDQQKAEHVWEKLKSETDVNQDMERATSEEKQIWRHQENDPAHVHGNSYTASVQNQADSQRVDLSGADISPMSDDAKAAIRKDLSQSLDTLTQDLEQSYKNVQKQEY